MAPPLEPPAGAPPAGEGFVLPGTRPFGCVLVHGFTATPWEMRPLGEGLAARGFPVRAVRLPGHGTDLADLARTRWTDWFAAVEGARDELARDAPRVAIAGMSLGALLALHLAATRPASVDALVLCGTPLQLGSRSLRLLPALARVPWVARRWAVIPKTGGSDVADPAVRATSPSYQAMPLAGVLELLRLRALVRRELDRIRQPTLLLHGRHDHSVPVATLAWLRARLGSPWIESTVLERSYHVITVDRDREQVVHLAADFLERVAAAGA